MSSIPIDLLLDIFTRLPPKSIARFRCLSKQWSSMLHPQVFRPLPRLLFAIEQSGSGVWEFSSVLPSSSSSLVRNSDFHINFPAGDRDNMQMSCTSSRQFSCGYASGLVYFSGLWIKNQGQVPVICKPNSGQYVALPYLCRYRRSYSFFGFDPIHKKFKVLFMTYPFCNEGGDDRILTLGTRKMKWRKIKCFKRHIPLSEGICINGIVYYLADSECSHSSDPDMIVCFDVMSKKFKFVDVECFGNGWFTQLVKYKGEKLCLVYWKYDADDHDVIELCMWVLEDVEKQEWSKYSYILRDGRLADRRFIFSVVGVIATTGEIVLSMTYTCQPIYVLYFNPERNTLQSVEIRGFGVSDEPSDHVFHYLNVFTFLDHGGEDFNADDLKLFESISISAPPSVKNKCITERPKFPWTFRGR